MIRHTLIVVCLLFPAMAKADAWNLPQSLTTGNTKVTFAVDSTWHLIEGTVSKIDGEVWLENPTDYRSIKANIRIPIFGFDTGNKSRDERMREVMHVNSSPNVVFKLESSIPTLCDPALLENGGVCKIEIPGEVIINNIAKPIIIRSEISKTGDSYVLQGITILRWSEFGVDDPSILIAKLHDEVKINITLNLNHKG